MPTLRIRYEGETPIGYCVCRCHDTLTGDDAHLLHRVNASGLRSRTIVPNCLPCPEVRVDDSIAAVFACERCAHQHIVTVIIR